MVVLHCSNVSGINVGLLFSSVITAKRVTEASVFCGLGQCSTLCSTEAESAFQIANLLSGICT